MANIEVCVVEIEHPAPLRLERRLPEFGPFDIHTVAVVPENLANLDVVILNNVPLKVPVGIPDIEESRFVAEVNSGKGALLIHDTVYPFGRRKQLLEWAGIRYAFGPVREDGYVEMARADSRDPLQRFPVRPSPEGAGHPILDGVSDFELAEEVWAQNVAPGARQLLLADVGDRIRASSRFKEPIPVAACKVVDRGRVAFFSLGHFRETYEDSAVLRFFANTINWLAKRTPVQRDLYDVFLSYSSVNKDRALRFAEVLEKGGLRIFRDEVEIRSGDKWEESIRNALVNSRELAILVTPASLSSEWVQTEWGAAWALQKHITPVLYRCDIGQLPERLRRYEAIDFDDAGRFVRDVRSRSVA